MADAALTGRSQTTVPARHLATPELRYRTLVRAVSPPGAHVAMVPCAASQLAHPKCPDSVCLYNAECMCYGSNYTSCVVYMRYGSVCSNAAHVR